MGKLRYSGAAAGFLTEPLGFDHPLVAALRYSGVTAGLLTGVAIGQLLRRRLERRSRDGIRELRIPKEALAPVGNEGSVGLIRIEKSHGDASDIAEDWNQDVDPDDVVYIDED